MIRITNAARERILSFIQQEGEDDLALRVSVGGSPLAPQFDLSLVEAWQQTDNDMVIDSGGFKLMVDREQSERLEGATIDWVETSQGGGFQVEAPKAQRREPPKGPLADRIKGIIERQVNPAVRMHGGQVTLVDVEDDKVFVELSGGCQGCGMAGVTLKQGIERMITQMVPEINEVVDVTDHSAGTNPYFQASK